MSSVIQQPLPSHLGLVPDITNLEADSGYDPSLATQSRSPIADEHKITRLLCARIYFYGIFGGIVAIHRLLGPPLRGTDPGIGYDRRVLLFHALQSSLLSIVFFAAAMFVAYDGAFADTSTDNWYYVLVALLIVKLAIINPWLARYFFQESAKSRKLHIPILGAVAEYICDALPNLSRVSECNTFYFKRDRPFLGYGTEINVWTLVIDTSVSATGVEAMAGINREARPLSVDKLYEAIIGAIRKLDVQHLAMGWRTFVDGCYGREIRRADRTPLRRPSQTLSTERIDQIDREGVQGRRYLVLQSQNALQDLVATQFIRFSQTGKLIFCEFASYILPSAIGRLYWIDRLFKMNPIAYNVAALMPVALFAAAATLLYPFLYSLPFLEIPHPYMNLKEYIGNYYLLDIQYLWTSGRWPYTMPVLAALVIVGFVIVQLVQWMTTLVSVLLGLKNQYGLAFSYRERFTSHGALGYFDLQEVTRFLKTQEKLLLHSLLEVLREHNVDTTDLKESVVAFINQGVVNSGDIRGSITNNIRSFMFRHPARNTTRRRTRRAA